MAKTAKSTTAAKTASAGTKAKRRTGQTKKKLKRAFGAPTGQLAVQAPPTTVAEAKSRWKERGRSSAGSGHRLRGTALATWQAIAALVAIILKYPKLFAERGLDAMTVKGLVALGDDFKAYAVSAAGAESPSATEAATGTADVVQQGFNFVTARRRGLQRLLRGVTNATMRHDFGIRAHLSVKRPSTVLGGLRSLLAGRNAHPGTRAAAYLTDGDVKKIQALATAVADYIATVDGGRLQSTQETKTERVLQTALELFFDDFAAAVEAVFEEQPEERVRALSLIPRRPDARRTQPAPAPSGDGGTTPSQPVNATPTTSPIVPPSSGGTPAPVAASA